MTSLRADVMRKKTESLAFRLLLFIFTLQKTDWRTDTLSIITVFYNNISTPSPAAFKHRPPVSGLEHTCWTLKWVLTSAFLRSDTNQAEFPNAWWGQEGFIWIPLPAFPSIKHLPARNESAHTATARLGGCMWMFQEHLEPCIKNINHIAPILAV